MLGNLSELASMPGMPSEPTIKKWIDENPDFPIVKRGDRGVGWEIDLALAGEFIRRIQRRKEDEARQRADDVRQFGFELLGPDAVSLNAASAPMSLADQKAAMELELVAIKLAQQRGELVRRDEAEKALSLLAVAFTERVSNFVARAAKRMTLTREQQVQLTRIVEGDRHWIADQLEKTRHAASTDHGDPGVRDGGGHARAHRGDSPSEGGADGERVGDPSPLV